MTRGGDGEPLLVVLAGGRGSRLGPLTETTPKPLVRVGGIPVLSHVLHMYRSAGVDRAVIAAGYLSEQVAEEYAADDAVAVIDTGADTGTAGRLLRLGEHLPQTFCVTYSDSVSDVRIADVLDFHRKHGRLATVTAVRPPARYGVLALDGARVSSFAEKDPTTGPWINGGFLVLEREVLALVDGDASMLERQVLPRLAERGELLAFRHDGFWWGMDTAADLEHLNGLWDDGNAPWWKA